jgi:hypothetical protein
MVEVDMVEVSDDIKIPSVPGVLSGGCIGVQLSLLSMFNKKMNDTNLIMSYYESQSLYCDMKYQTCLECPRRHGCPLNSSHMDPNCLATSTCSFVSSIVSTESKVIHILVWTPPSDEKLPCVAPDVASPDANHDP